MKGRKLTMSNALVRAVKDCSKSLLIRVGEKAGINRIEKIFTLEDAHFLPELNSMVEVRLLTEDELIELTESQTYRISAEDRARVTTDIAACFGAFCEGQFAGAGWYALKPYHHSGGLIAEFSNDWICGYGAYVEPEFRGKGIRQAIVRKALQYAHSKGRKGILAAIDWDNSASINGGLRMGYQPKGYSIWWPLNPLQLSSLYHLRLINRKLDDAFSLPKMAVITPFQSPVLETAFASTQLSLVIDCGGSQRLGLKEQLKNSLRNLTGRESNLKDWAKRRSIPYITYKKESSNTVLALKEQEIELLVSYAAPLLPESEFSQPQLGTVNLHPSLLPKYRGGRPLFWQIFEGDMEGGITLHQVDSGIDTGKILSQRKVDLTGTYQRENLAQLARQNSANVFSDFVWQDLLRNQVSAIEIEGQMNTRFANQTSLNQLLEEFPIEVWPLERMVRVAKYLGYWPPHFGLPKASKRGYPINMIAHGLYDKKSEDKPKSSPYVLEHPDGWVEFVPTKSIKAAMKHRLKLLRQRTSELADIYL